MTPPVYLKNISNQNVIQELTVELVTWETYFTTTKNACPGRWYYEFTHLGGSYTYLVGFSIGETAKYAFFTYPMGQKHDLYLYYYNDSISGHSTHDNSVIDPFSRIDFDSLNENPTIGIAFDSYTRIITIIYNNQSRYYHISTPNRNLNVSPFLQEGSPGSGSKVPYKDNVSVNFGQDDFVYKVPYGYLPWIVPYHPCTCKIKTRITTPIIFVFLLFDKS